MTHQLVCDKCDNPIDGNHIQISSYRHTTTISGHYCEDCATEIVEVLADNGIIPH